MFETDADYNLDDVDFMPAAIENARQINRDTPNNAGLFKKPMVSLRERQFLDKMRHQKLPTTIRANEHRTVVQRKFPGPAGLLPNSQQASFSINNQLEGTMYENDDNDDSDILCSQVTANIFSDSTWLQMQSDLVNEAHLLNKYNINWIKRLAEGKSSVGHKIPFLVALITTIESFAAQKPTPTVTLKDPSGEISGVLHHDLYETYFDEIKIGSVLVLKNLSVLIMGHGVNHYLTITLNNLVTIYSVNKNESQTQSVGNLERLEACKAQNLRNNQLFNDNSKFYKDNINYTQNIGSNVTNFSDTVATTIVSDFRNQKTIESNHFSHIDDSLNIVPQKMHNNCDDLREIYDNFNLDAKRLKLVQNTTRNFNNNSNFGVKSQNCTPNNIFESEFDIDAEFSDDFDENVPEIDENVNKMHSNAQESPEDGFKVPEIKICDNSNNLRTNRFKMFQFVTKNRDIVSEPNLGPCKAQSTNFLGETNCQALRENVIEKSSNFLNNASSPSSISTKNGLNNSQMSDIIENSQILQEVFDGVDTDSFFDGDDF